MPKLDLLDLETFINLPTAFVNPLELPLQIDQNLLLNVASPPELLLETTNVLRRGQAESSGVFYEPKESKLKLEMEIFGDLSAYWPLPTKAMAASRPFQNAVDELNTPVFEKAPFNYDRPSHSSGLLDVITSIEDPFNFKIKSEPSSFDNVNIEDTLMIKEDSIEFKEGESKDISNMPIDISTNMGGPVNNYIVINSPGISTNSSNVFTPSNSEYEDIYRNPSDKVTPMYKELIEDDVSLAAVNPSDIFLNHNSNDYGISISNDNSNTEFGDSSNQYIIIQTAPYETPESSRSASVYSDNSSPTTLTLTIDKKFKSENVIDTPDVIDTIDAIENEKGFNILNFITDEDIHTAAPALSTIDLPALSSTGIPQQSSSRVKLAPKRRYRRDDEDDDDYVPPLAKKRAIGRTEPAPAAYYSDSDSSDDEETLPKTARRGRPPKRNVSISSEDCPVGKYREMRDKNNEASRKSRLKRKMKEVAQEEEASGLVERNMKLKAQVEELEKTVTNFRNNLMKILMTK